MKKTAFIALALTASLAIQAAPLTPEEALEKALETSQVRIASSGQSAMQLKFTQEAGNQPAVYIFNRASTPGFIAVSADDCTTSLLGYSDECTLPDSMDELPDGMRYWIESLAEQVAINARTGVNSHGKQKSPQRTTIWPLCATRWNQSSPYNNLCPTVGDTRCVTGCVATAMAQVLKYYEYPTTGVGTHSYTWRGQTLSFNYANTTFDWDNMLDRYTTTATDEEKNAVATLMRACGISVDMSYGTVESGAVSLYLLNGLIDNFGYDKGCKYLMRDYYYINEWEDLVYSNLENCGPILYSGRSNDGGHQFVCDGYRDGYFHFNWGWGGMSDGWFLMTVLDPGAQGIGGSSSGYNFSQAIIADVYTNQTSETPYEQIVWEGQFKIDESSAALGSAITFRGGFRNQSYATISTPTIGIYLIPETGNPVFATYGTFSDLMPLYGLTSDADYTATIPSNLAEGTYTVVPAWRDVKNVVHKIPVAVNGTQSYVMTVSGKTAYFSANRPTSVLVEDFQLESELYKGSDFKVSATITNPSKTEEFTGVLSVILTNDSGKAVATSNNIKLVLGPGETTDWELISPLRYFADSNGNAVVPDAGTYNMWLVNNIDTERVYLQDVWGVTLHDAATPDITIQLDKAAENQYYWDFKVTATVSCNSGYFSGTFPLYIFEPDNEYSITSQASNFVTIGGSSSSSAPMKAASSDKLNWTVNIPNGKTNTVYRYAVRYNNGWAAADWDGVKSNISTGIDFIEVEVPGIAKREYISLSGINLGEEKPAAGLYIVRDTLEDGTVCTHRMIVK